MNSKDLNYRTEWKRGQTRLPEHDATRFIYVYRPYYNDILLRAYDRGPDYSQYQYPDNCPTAREDGGKACSGKYNHVRHSQLNGGWNPVWCAGEMRIENGAVCLINNESGHFRPNPLCTTRVLNTLRTWGASVSSNVVYGPFKTHSAANACNSKDEL